MHGNDDLGHTPQPWESYPAAAISGAHYNLLFGIIALQNDFITREALVAAFDVWTQDKFRTMPEILQSLRALSSEDREILERLVGKFLERHGHDEERSLAALSPVGALRLDLERLNDPDLGASLGHIGQERPPDPDLGTTLLHANGSSLGRFRILRPHAKGGLGQVSVALDQELNREVALKEIQPQHADNVVARERFVVEAEITGALEHPGIVPVYALGQGHDGRPFYAMRFIKGDSFKQAIEVFHTADNPNRADRGARQLALRQLLGRFIDVCNAMEYAHSRGVVHRDLKPDNIMIGKYGETLVVDWGLAKSVGKKEIVSDEPTLHPASPLSSSGQTRPGSAIGTPAYMSPEQAVGKLEVLGPASDVYSLGATLYHLLCGNPPFDKKNLGDILLHVQKGLFPKPRSVAGEVSAALEAICLKAMSLAPADRYQRARALADDLEHWLADEPIAAAPDSLGESLSRLARKHRGYVRAGAVAMTLIALVSTVAALYVNQSRNDALSSAGREREAKTKAQELAKRNEQLADSQTKLAEEQSDLLNVLRRELRISTAERLAALSHAKRFESPELGLLLAVESCNMTRLHDEGLLASSHQSLLDALSRIGGRPLIGLHTGPLARISPDGRWIVSASNDSTASVWSLNADGPSADSRVLSGHEEAILCLGISPDSRWVVTGSVDKTARVWDLKAEDATAKPYVLSGHQETIAGVTVSPDSRWIFTWSLDKTLRVWDLKAPMPEACVCVLIGTVSNRIDTVKITPDGSKIVAVGREEVRIWDLDATGPAPIPRILIAAKLELHCAAISPNSRWLVTGSLTGAAHIWDLESNDHAISPRVMTGQSLIESVAISPDGRWVATVSKENVARIWDLMAADPAVNPRVLSGHKSLIIDVAFSPDSRWVVTGSADNTARVWSVLAEDPSANARTLTGHEGPVSSVAVSGDGRWIVTGSWDRRIRVWSGGSLEPHSNPQVLYGNNERFYGGSSRFYGMAISPAVCHDILEFCARVLAT